MAQLPKVVQDAILSADVEKHLRELADTHKLHLDQWSLLENEVMLALLGFQKAEDLAEHIEKEVGVDAETAKALSADISRIVFAPIRAQLEKELEYPGDEEKEGHGESSATPHTAPQAPQPAAPKVPAPTPPAAKPEGTVERNPAYDAYKMSGASTTRKTVHDDPYREPPK